MDEKQLVEEILRKFEIFWSKFNRKINFCLFLGKFVAKNRAFGNNIIFLQQFFPVGGGGWHPLRTPLYIYDEPLKKRIFPRNDLGNFWNASPRDIYFIYERDAFVRQTRCYTILSTKDSLRNVISPQLAGRKFFLAFKEKILLFPAPLPAPSEYENRVKIPYPHK